MLLIYVFYTRTIPRRYLLSTFAFCFPFLLIFSISLYTKIDVSFKFFFTGLFSDNLFALAPLDLVFIFYPLIFTFYKLLTSFSGFKMTNHQIHFQRVMFLVFLSTVYVFFAHANGDGFLWLFIIPATYFISKGILEIEKKWVRTLAFFLVLLQTVYPYLLAANL